jgi:hypothetical protein
LKNNFRIKFMTEGRSRGGALDQGADIIDINRGQPIKNAGPQVGDPTNAWGDPTEEYNAAAQEAREKGWLDDSGRLTLKGVNRLAERDKGRGEAREEMEKVKAGRIKAIIKEKGRQKQVRVAEVRELAADLDLGQKVQVMRNGDGGYKIMVASGRRGRMKELAGYSGSLKYLMDKLEEERHA